jgi:hypothetical protein
MRSRNPHGILGPITLVSVSNQLVLPCVATLRPDFCLIDGNALRRAEDVVANATFVARAVANDRELRDGHGITWQSPSCYGRPCRLRIGVRLLGDDVCKGFALPTISWTNG